MTFSVCQEYLNLASFFASVVGLYLLLNDPLIPPPTEVEDPDTMLLALSFGYWIIHCVALSAQKWVTPDWEIMLLSLKFATLFSYLLTFCCILSLPLNRIAARQQRVLK
jgi:hypothetical protein